MPTVVALERIDGAPKRRRVVFDDASEVELALEVALAAGLVPGASVARSVVAEARTRDALQQAERDALSLLGRKDLSVGELQRKLATNGHPDSVIDQILEKCRQWGYLNNRRLAERIVADGVALKHHGPARLRHTLRSRGIEDTLAEDVLSNASENQPPPVEQAIAALKSKQRSYARLEPDVARRRMIAFLQRRGFGFDTIREALGLLKE